MITGKEDLLTALGEAFLMEKGTKIFYTEAAEWAVNEDARKMFNYLSEWEEEHMDYIMTLYKGIMEDWGMVTYEEFKNKAAANMTEAGIPLKYLEGKLATYCITDEMGALTIAMEIEGKSYNMYRKLSQSASDINVQSVFKEMMEQELKHINHLKELRVKLADIYNP
jgi:rubrerythrin